MLSSCYGRDLFVLLIRLRHWALLSLPHNLLLAFEKRTVIKLIDNLRLEAVRFYQFALRPLLFMYIYIDSNNSTVRIASQRFPTSITHLSLCFMECNGIAN